MKSFGLALFLSLAFHGLIAAGLILYFDYAPAPDELAKLELTSVDLSFAETPDETAAAAPASAPMPQTPPPKPIEPKTEPSPPEMTPPTEPTLPQPDVADLPKPEEPREQFEEESFVQPSTSTSDLQPPIAPLQAKIDAPPKPRRAITPDYPKESRQRGEQGIVTLEIDVNAEGTVDAVRVAKPSGFPILDEAAVKAARAARFTPAKSGGKPVASTARLTLNFKLK